MSIAAVPGYLVRHDLSQASPGLRFGLFLPIWTDRPEQEREIRQRARGKSREARDLDEYLSRHGMDATIAAWQERDRNPLPRLWQRSRSGAVDAWKQIASLGEDDRARMRALGARQTALAEAGGGDGSLFRIDGRAVAPFTTGLGLEHPLENGFAFLNPYGLPYLPGSGVKGVLRQAARELAGVSRQAQWDIPSAWTSEAIDALFGKEAVNGDGHQRGALTFWDVIPQLAGDTLVVEVMTGHQAHYHQSKEAPHESGQPNPVNFLTVPPDSSFTFHIQCNRPFLSRVAPDLESEGRWQALLQEAFAHAFAWLGFGAKTAVGYGAMEPDQEAAAARAEAKAEAELESMRQEERELLQLADWLEEDRAAGRKEAGGRLSDQTVKLIKTALDDWDAQDCQRLADLAEEVYQYLGWPANKKKKQARRADIDALRKKGVD